VTGGRARDGGEKSMTYENIIVERRDGVGLITLNRPEALNALSGPLMAELGAALDELEADDGIGALVLTGSEKAFAAGADIKEMQDKTWPGIYLEDFGASADRIARRRKPLIAAVAGYALGGGCEIAMLCDFILAAETARFGQPEITLGVTPGFGGTQRLTRQVGKSKAMEMCLTGRMMDAEEAERAGLVSRIVPADELVEEAVKTARKIAGMSGHVTMAIKEAVDRSYEVGLDEGVRFERRLFQAGFGSADQKEGMAAFIEKRKPDFRNA
jgi:enoyl-CoA hydratase